MDNKLLELNQRLIALVEDYSEGLPIGEWTESKSILIYAFVKGYRTSNSVLLLCEKGNGQDAFMLVRTLFELMVTVGYIFNKDTEERTKMYNGYDWVLRDKMFRNISNNKQAQKLLKERNSGIDFDEMEQKAKTHKETYGNSWSGKSIEKMAKEIGVGQLYKTLYALGSQLTHSAPRSANDYMKVKDDEVELLTYPSEIYVNESLVGCFFCFYHIIQQLNEILELGIGKELRELEWEATKQTEK